MCGRQEQEKEKISLLPLCAYTPLEANPLNFTSKHDSINLARTSH